MVFGGLYVLFQLIFYLGDNKKPKKEKVKKEEKKDAKEPIKEVEPKQEKTIKEKIVVKDTNEQENKKDKTIKTKDNKQEELIYLEEDKPAPVVIEPYYSHYNHSSYITNAYNIPERRITTEENYLHDYYNDGKTFDNIQPKKAEDKSKAQEHIEMAKKSDEIVQTYNSLPVELKKYILEKILASK